ncbi:MAG: hypothetical protein GY941_22440 [Planctomycetes bacterium]|nr:hypothetical protein [Planctomycetota bacterium]
MNFQQAVSVYALSPVPLAKGKKNPLIGWKQYAEDGVPLGVACEWDTQHSPNDMGILCGLASDNLEVLDIDNKNSLNGECYLTELGNTLPESLLGKLKSCVICPTPSGGFHVLYKVDSSAVIDGNKKLASVMKDGRPQAVIETRGQGGLIRLYEPAEWSTGLDGIPTLTIEDRNAIHSYARSLSKIVKVDPVHKESKQKVRLGGEVKPWEDYNESVELGDTLNLLMEHDWQLVNEYGSMYELTRPGKNTKDGISARLGGDNGNVFWCWSSSTEFTPEQAYSPSAVLCQLEYGDPFSEDRTAWGLMAKALEEQGYGIAPEVARISSQKARLLGEPTLDLTDEETAQILACITTPEQDMQEFLAFKAKGKAFRLSKRFADLLPMMEAITQTEVVGIVGESSGGKSLVARQVINDSLVESNEYGLFVTLEMNKRSLALRNAMELSEPHRDDNYVNPVVVGQQLMEDKDFRVEATKRYSNLHTMSYRYDLDNIREITRLYKAKLAKEGKDLTTIVIDFFGLLNGGTKVDQQDELAQKLKQMADKDDMIVFPLLQTNKAFDADRDPHLNDISGNGAIKQALDYALFISKHPAYNNRFILNSVKERNTKNTKCDLVANGIHLHAEPHEPVDASAIRAMAGVKVNRGL